MIIVGVGEAAYESRHRGTRRIRIILRDRRQRRIGTGRLVVNIRDRYTDRIGGGGYISRAGYIACQDTRVGRRGRGAVRNVVGRQRGKIAINIGGGVETKFGGGIQKQHRG